MACHLSLYKREQTREVENVKAHILDVGSCLHFSVTVPVASKTMYMTAIENHTRDYPGSRSLYNTPDSDACPRHMVLDGYQPCAFHSHLYRTQLELDQRTTAVEPLLLRNKVDLAVWGHVHNYERTCAVFQGRCLQHPIKDLAGVISLTLEFTQLQFMPWLAWPNSAWMTSLIT
ncbi:hypothetical protein SELMODRAFT_423309 [Selaginella moellendorffii]|uniref:Calcineurin-like phosphoesterase domain-containing protein n=1 Tax=Selaginella moellendorffii TaxID=88036 RepID=D8SL92_SELML|nr:hypothetical protein SELMODRAFT_423309 [Selaginella moellendorffii]